MSLQISRIHACAHSCHQHVKCTAVISTKGLGFKLLILGADIAIAWLSMQGGRNISSLRGVYWTIEQSISLERPCPDSDSRQSAKETLSKKRLFFCGYVKGVLPAGWVVSRKTGVDIITYELHW